MRVWEIVAGVLAVALASVPTTLMLQTVYPAAGVSVAVNASEITALFQSSTDYQPNPTTPVGVIGDFVWAVAKFFSIVSAILIGSPGKPPAAIQILTNLGVPPWLLTVAAAIIAVALFRAMLYLVSGRNVDYV
ncbi:MAG: hypothetical protein QW512_06180 [Thermofilaceae archaeon]